MIINIISNQANRDRITGPKKVLVNSCKGFDGLGIKYVFNQPINDYECNWIHDDAQAIIEAGFINKPVIVGPNIVVLPKDLPKLRKSLHPDSVYLFPSQWVLDLWKQLEFKECKVDVWPVGIDLDSFIVKKRIEKDPEKILIYFKQRDKKILTKVKQILKDKNLEFEIIYYGFYKEDEYRNTLNQSKLCIWIGCSESQGIALQEALATGMPIIVLDANSLFDAVSENKKGYFDYALPRSLSNIVTTSAPYFDERCGLKINNIDKLSSSIDYVFTNINTFSPRDYIKENLSLEKSSEYLMKKLISVSTNNIKSSNNYQKIAKYLYYIDLLGKKWFYKWVYFKLKNYIGK